MLVHTGRLNAHADVLSAVSSSRMSSHNAQRGQHALYAVRPAPSGRSQSPDDDHLLPIHRLSHWNTQRAQDPGSFSMLAANHKQFDPQDLPPLVATGSRHPAMHSDDPSLAAGGISPYPDSAATTSSGPFSPSSPPLIDHTAQQPTARPPPPMAPQSSSTSSSAAATGRARRARKEKPYIALAADQPPTTQGKPRTRVFVACLQWYVRPLLLGSSLSPSQPLLIASILRRLATCTVGVARFAATAQNRCATTATRDRRRGRPWASVTTILLQSVEVRIKSRVRARGRRILETNRANHPSGDGGGQRRQPLSSQSRLFLLSSSPLRHTRRARVRTCSTPMPLSPSRPSPRCSLTGTS